MTIRLSGFSYIILYGSRTTKVGKWRTRGGDNEFEYCGWKNCKHSDEHEYAFDGQVFYKKAKL